MFKSYIKNCARNPIFNTVNTNIKYRASGKIEMSQINRTSTLNTSLRAAVEFKVKNKSFEENTLMSQRNNKLIVNWQLFITINLGKIFNDYSQTIIIKSYF